MPGSLCGCWSPDCCFACMGVMVKFGAAHFSSSELVFYRSFFGLLIVYAMLRRSHVALATRHWRSHLWRGLSGTIAMLLFFYCISVLPLATAVTLNYTSSLFLSLLTVLVLKDKFHLPLSSSLAVGFVRHRAAVAPDPGARPTVTGLARSGLRLTRRQSPCSTCANSACWASRDMRVVFYFNLIATLGQRRVDVARHAASDLVTPTCRC